MYDNVGWSLKMLKKHLQTYQQKTITLLSNKTLLLPSLDPDGREGGGRASQLQSSGALGERQCRAHVQERAQAPVPGKCRAQRGARVGAYTLRPRQRHRALSQSRAARQVPRDDQAQRSAGPPQAKPQGLRPVDLRGGREEPAAR